MAASPSIGTNQNQGNPDLKFCAWPRAFDNAVQTIIDSVFKERALIELYNCYSEFVNVLVSDVVQPKLCTAIAPGKLTWTLENVGFTIRADQILLGTVKNFVKEVSGSFTVDITVTSSLQFRNPFVNVRINLSGVSSPAFRLSDFDTSPSPSTDDSDGVKDFKRSAEFRLQLNATESDRDDRKRSWTQVDPTEGSDGEPSTKRMKTDVPVQSTESSINETICCCLLHAFAIKVMHQVNCSLPVYSRPSGTSNDCLLSFTAMSMPEFQNGFMMTSHLCALSYRGETIKAPTPTAPFPEPQNSRRMLTMFISNYVINTIGYCFQRHDILNYNLTQADLIPQATEDDSTTDTSVRTRSLSDCFPEFSVKYPGASVEVSISSSEAPTSTFSGQHLKITLLGSAIFRAHLEDGSLADFLKTAVALETTVLMTLEVEKLVGTVISILPTSLTIVESALDSVNNEVLREVFNLIMMQFLNRKFEEVTQKGIPLPPPFIPGDFQYENTEIQAEDNYLRFDTDLKFNACAI